MGSKQIWWAVIIIVTAIVSVPAVMLASQYMLSVERGSPMSYGIDGEHLSALAFDWQDVDSQQQTFPLDEPSYTYLFMGFLSCSEICPIRINQLRELESKIDNSAKLRNLPIKFMFITIDPDNDTPAVRQQVIDDQSERFFSAALTAQDLLALSQYLSENIQAHSPIQNHVGNLYLTDPQGSISRMYTSKQLSTDKMLADLQQIIKAS
ncbi:SCO family protein [Shewanella gaetbuli]